MSRIEVTDTVTAPDPIGVGARIHDERVSLRMTQGDLAARLGLKSAVAVSRYEAGQLPRSTILARMAAIFGKSVDWILHEKESGEVVYKVADPPEIYGEGLDRDGKNILKEVENFWREACPEFKRHLRTQLRILKDAQKTRAKRASGKD